MEQKINELLLKTAFACMACDGNIAPEEVELIKNFDNDGHLFGDINVDEELKSMVEDLNELGKIFLKNYLNTINESQLNEDDSIKVLDVAAKMIKADDIIQYSEIKFFKVIKANLNVSDKTILEKVEGIDDMWIAQDIKDYGILYDAYFENIELPKFDLKVLSQETQEDSQIGTQDNSQDKN